MNIALTIALLGAAVSVIGWVVTHILTSFAERRLQRLIFQMEFTRQQLEELYGPLAFLVWEGLQSYSDMKSSLDTHKVFHEGKVLSEEGFKTWLFWVEHEFLPHDTKIQKLLASKTHLVEGETIPESFLAFLNYYNSWRVNHERWQKQGVEYGWKPKLHWPDTFDEEVLSTFKMLKKRHAILTGMVAENENVFRSLQRRFRRETRINHIEGE